MLLTVNGLPVDARFDAASERGCIRPLLSRLSALRQSRGGRVIALLAAPPGAGKSVIAAYMAAMGGVSALGMDGFHYPQAHILSHTVLRGGREIPMRDVKGAPESFDLARLTDAVRRLRTEDIAWPEYDRRAHDVKEGDRPVRGEICLIEGNWLLLDEAGWRGIPAMADLTVRLDADEALLMPRLIARKVRGGMPEAAARAFCEESDLRNIRRFREHALAGDLNWRAEADGALRAADACGRSAGGEN